MMRDGLQLCQGLYSMNKLAAAGVMCLGGEKACSTLMCQIARMWLSLALTRHSCLVYFFKLEFFL